MNLEQLGKKAEFWCNLLGIEDNWRVSVTLGDERDMPDLSGYNEISAEHQISKIVVAKDEDEEILVHEILHILLDGYKSDEERNYSVMHERAINKIADALVALTHPKKKNAKKKSAGTVPQNLKPIKRKKANKASNSKATSRPSRTV